MSTKKLTNFTINKLKNDIITNKRIVTNLLTERLNEYIIKWIMKYYAELCLLAI